MGYALSTFALGPLLYWQGRRVRRRVPLLPEPLGDRIGATGRGPGLRLLIVGDSAAAGVGADHQSDALLGQAVSRLEDFRVEWRLEAKTGATTSSTLDHLKGLEPDAYDVVVTSLGVNDVTAGRTRRRWLDEQRELRALLGSRFAARLIVACGLPPVEGFPALPQPLRWYLGGRAKRFTRDLERDVAGRPGCRFLDLRFTDDASLMASDGFHPGPGVYAMWGERVAAIIHETTGRSAMDET